MKERFIAGSCAAAATLIAVAACNGQSLDLGDNQVLRDASSAGSPAPMTSASTASDAGEDSASNDTADGDDETWTGYIENLTFADGSDSLRLTFTRHSDGTVSGHAIFGSLPLYPPPTDPSVGYPIAYLDGGFEPQDPEGFRYTLLNGTFADGRFRAGVNDAEIYAQWCSLQAPIQQSQYMPGENYGPCVPAAQAPNLPGNCSIDPSEGGVETVNCGAFLTCEICSCTSTACALLDPSSVTTDFDFQISGAHADGSVILPETMAPNNIHLTQQ